MTATISSLVNDGKKLLINVEQISCARLAIRTHIITKSDNIVNVCKQYALQNMQQGDVLFISERIVAISQGRAYAITDIKTGWLAKKLSQYVYKSPFGIGLGSEFTMQLAIKEAGMLRIIFAAAVAAVTKPLGIKGLFYRVVGNNINAIDGPCSYTIPPYNGYAKLGPKKPNTVAQEVSRALGFEVVIIDANDLGVNVLGRSSKNISIKFCQEVFKDNPLGQSMQQTPLCIVRRIQINQ